MPAVFSVSLEKFSQTRPDTFEEELKAKMLVKHQVNEDSAVKTVNFYKVKCCKVQKDLFWNVLGDLGAPIPACGLWAGENLSPGWASHHA